MLEIDHDITRHFDLDYVLFDVIFLAAFVVLLARRRRIALLKAGLACAVLMYLIDGVIWFATGVREYAISAPWIKHPTDFMMDVSYGIVAFSWVWIAFEGKSRQDVAFWTIVLFAGWLIVSLASRLLAVNDDPITTARHMRSQVWLQIVVVLAGYALLIAFGYEFRTILYLFWIGCMLSFMMEFSLLVTGIRPANVRVLIYETLILTNQSVPYVYVIWDRILPSLADRIAARSVRSA